MKTVLTIEFTIAADDPARAEDAANELRIAMHGIRIRKRRFAGVTIQVSEQDISHEVRDQKR